MSAQCKIIYILSIMGLLSGMGFQGYEVCVRGGGV